LKVRWIIGAPHARWSLIDVADGRKLQSKAREWREVALVDLVTPQRLGPGETVWIDV